MEIIAKLAIDNKVNYKNNNNYIHDKLRINQKS
jgi:hypothetical protein